ncbi:MAG TPA: phenylacetate--CoA ligase [Alicyclobacillus sp.]|nr:phenylacetate--CoA ligase [Alicyclobacillus sp.]
MVRLPEQWPPVYDRTYVPGPEEKYWNPAVETMTPEQLHDHVLQKLKRQIRYVYDHSEFYRRKWAAVGFEPGDLKAFEDFERLPFTTKQELREDQMEHPPYGSNLCISQEEIFHIHGTSGTTGKPTVFALSKGDWERMAEAHARVMWAFGLRPSDRVFIGSVFSLYVGSWGALAGVERLGAAAFPFGAGQPGQTEKAVRWMWEVKPSAFYGTPSYALYLAEKAKELGIDPRKFGIRILFFSGEPGAGVPATRRRIENTFGGICVDTGSMAEATPWMANGECEHRQGMHLWQDIVYTEVVNPETKQRVPYGREGVPVYTHLERQAQPMVRLWSGDLTLWTNEPCPCGRPYPRLPRGIYGRVDDMVVVRGVNVYPSAVEDVVRSIPGLGDEFRLVVSREGIMDDLAVQVEVDTGVQDDPATVGDSLRQKLKSVLGLSVHVEVLPSGTLERTEFKARRVVDKRRMQGAASEGSSGA